MAKYIVREVDENLYILRVDDKYTKFFEALWEIPEGITYNAYILKTRDGAILFDGWKKPFSGLLVDALEELVRPNELKYIVVHHMEPDHSGSLEDVARFAPQATVLGHPLLSKMLERYPRARKNFKPIRESEEIKIGGEVLQFIYAPWLHWPETIMTWIKNRKILLTCDVFGGYGIPYGIFDDECVREEEAIRSIKKYVVTVIGHYSDWIRKALEKLERMKIEPEIIAPAHGLVWREKPRKVVEVYKKLSLGDPTPRKITIIYASMYGTLEALSKTLNCVLSKKGYKTKIYGYNDSERPLVSEVLTDVADSEALIIAAPTYEASVFPLLDHLISEICWKTVSKNKKAVVLSSYGWGGVAAKKVKERLSKCGYRVVGVFEVKSIGPAPLSGDELREMSNKIAAIIEEH